MFDYAISKNVVTLGNANLVPNVTLVEVEEVDLFWICVNFLCLFIQHTEATKQ